MNQEAALSDHENAIALATLIVMSGEASGDNMPLEVQLHLRRRLVGIGAVPLGASLEATWQVVGDLIQHLHHLDRGSPYPKVAGLPVENVVAFADEATARRYAAEMCALGKDVDDPVHEPSFRRWTVVIRAEQVGGHGSPTTGREAHAAHLLGGWHLGARG